MVRNVAAALLLLLLGSQPLLARLGETLDQCKQRYGKATAAIPPVYDFGSVPVDLVYFNFEKNGIGIQVGFLNGKAADLSFTHMDPPGDLTPVEIETLLQANAGGLNWTVVQEGKLVFFPEGPGTKIRYGPFHQRDDGVMATLDGPTLHIFTPEWMDYVNVKMKAHSHEASDKQKKNLEGF